MSDREQHELLGRLIFEEAECKRQLAAIGVKVKRVAAYLTHAGEAISRRCDAIDKPREDGRLPELGIALDAESYLNMEVLNSLLEEQTAAFQKHYSTTASISRLKP